MPRLRVPRASLSMTRDMSSSSVMSTRVAVFSSKVECVTITHRHVVGNSGLPRSAGASGLENALLVIGEALDRRLWPTRSCRTGRNAVVVDRDHVKRRTLDSLNDPEWHSDLLSV